MVSAATIRELLNCWLRFVLSQPVEIDVVMAWYLFVHYAALDKIIMILWNAPFYFLSQASTRFHKIRFGV
jgi:hypothetical protein